MSNAVGKAREHEQYKKMLEENKSRAKFVLKTESDDELKTRVLSLLRDRNVPEKNIGPSLHLSYVTSLRLSEIMGDLVKSGRVTVKLENGEKIFSLAS